MVSRSILTLPLLGAFHSRVASGLSAQPKAPRWWSSAWNVLPQPGEPGSPIGVGDFLGEVRSNLESSLFGACDEVGDVKQDGSNSYYCIPDAIGVDPASMQRDFFDNLRDVRSTVGPVFNINLGAASVTYIGDPLAVKTILLNAGSYDKGLLGFISGDVFGEGLITALDRDVWQRRRRAVAPTLGASKGWLDGLIDDFVQCTEASFVTLDAVAETPGKVIDLEQACLAIALDALGRTVFGCEFNAANKIDEEGGDPLVGAVYRVLKETSVRSEKPASILASYIRPMWLAELFSSDLREFRNASRLLDAKINELIEQLKEGLNAGDTSESPSILRILVEARDGETTSQQVKDDLVTLLIAGHETVASVLTWALYELARNPDELKKVTAEIDAVFGEDATAGRRVTMQDVVALKRTRRALAESLRLYPAPPLLSRRALKNDVLPLAGGGPPLRLNRGDNVFLLTAMLQRDPRIYGEDAEEFRPDRWAGPILSNPSETPGWNGYEGPQSDPRALYPSEKATDFALVGFGAGEFKCVGDKFAFVEATVALALMLRRYDFALVSENVGFDMAATIHTSKGLMARVRRREIAAHKKSVGVDSRQKMNLH